MVRKFFVSPEITMSKALDQLNEVMGFGLVVVDDSKKILGTVTDGDIRRALVSGYSLLDSISEVMNQFPTVASKNTSALELEALTRDGKIKMIPILENGIVVDIHTMRLDDVGEIPVVLMAGGLGTRLGQLTRDCPKPMLEVGGKPVLERIIDNFTRVGFKKFYISVNFKADMIEDYFGDGSKLKCKINYLKESKRLGTAGSLGLLPEEVNGSIIVMNGDLLTFVDFRRLINFHQNHESKITMCTRKYDIQVPYGVVNINEGKVESMEEKPIHSFFVNAGVYVIDQSLLKYVPDNEYFDMPSLLETAIRDKQSVDCFPMVEKWIDIGITSDLDYARSLYGEAKLD